MKLVFSLQAEELLQKQKEISKTVAALYPDFPVYAELEKGRMSLCVPDDANVLDISEKLCEALRKIGVSAKRIAGQGGGMPPIRMNEKKQRTVSMRTLVISLVAVALAVFILGFSVSGGFERLFVEPTLGTGQQDGENYADKIAAVDGIFEDYSLYETDHEKLLNNMLKAYAAATGDRYAAYYTAEEYEALMSDNSANAVGVGIVVMKDPGSENLLIIRVIPGAPAALAGVRAGDLITYVGSGEAKAAVADIGVAAANDRLVGEAGSTADFTIMRDGAELTFSVVRSAIKTVSVVSKVSATDPSVGIVKIYEFDIETPVQFKQAMADLKQAGCTKLVFDVRDNPGGDLNSISAVLSYFLEEGQTLLTTTYKDGSETVYTVKPVVYEGANASYASCSVTQEEIGMYRSYIGSMTVLTNGDTASAAELFTIVMKDYGLAKILGETTFGKGIIQNVIPLKNYGFEGAVKLTVGYYNPPISENYNGVGIKPDTEVSLGENADSIILELLPEQDDPQLQAAIAALNAN